MVKIKIDTENREKLRKLHTATHILNYSAKKILGNHVWQNGSNLKPEIGTLDITHYENLTQDQISKIEELANLTVFENKKVKIEEIDRTLAEKKYGYTLYQGGAIPMKTLRVVNIENNDVEACGGIHMEKTGEVGLIKIVDAIKIQDGVIRLKYVVGQYALDFISKKQQILNNIKKVFNTDDKSLVKTSEKFFNEWKNQKKEIDNLKKILKESYIEQVVSSNKNELTLENDFDMAFIIDTFEQIISQKKSFKIKSPKFIIATQDIKIDKFKKQIKKEKYNIYIL